MHLKLEVSLRLLHLLVSLPIVFRFAGKRVLLAFPLINLAALIFVLLEYHVMYSGRSNRHIVAIHYPLVIMASSFLIIMLMKPGKVRRLLLVVAGLLLVINTTRYMKEPTDITVR